MFRRYLKKILFKKYKYKSLYIKFFKPSDLEFAQYLKLHDVFYSIGEQCSIQCWANITDPAYVKMGNNVQLSGCTLLGHDGSIQMLNKAYNKKLDRVGKIEIGDNVFIGHGAIVMPDTAIGSNVIVAAGAVVTKNIPDNSIVAGVPAKVIGELDKHVKRLEEYTESLPWNHIIKTREGACDPSLEPKLIKERVKFFYEK